MGKKESSEKTSSAKTEEIIPKKKISNTGKKKVDNEIDEIFSNKKRENLKEHKDMQKEDASSKQKSNSGQKKAGNEIDEIFSSVKKRKSPQEQSEKKKEDMDAKPKKLKKNKTKVQEREGFVDPPKSRKRTADGLTLYTEEELGIGKSDAGGNHFYT